MDHEYVDKNELVNDKFVRLDIAQTFAEHKQRVGQAISQFRQTQGANHEFFDDVDDELVMDTHRLTVEELLIRYNLSLDLGLSMSDVLQARAAFGRNEFGSTDRTPEIVKYFKEFFGLFAVMLWIGTILSFIGYSINPNNISNLYSGVVLIIIVITTSSFTYVQNRRSLTITEHLRLLAPRMVKVRRDGVLKPIPVAELVVADVVEIEKGDIIPADMRLVSVSRLAVDKSALTGESEPEVCTVDATSENPLETHNLVFSGTVVVEGAGVGVVIFTGDDTMLGRIIRLGGDTRNATPLINQEIQEFITQIAISSIIIGVLFFLAALLINYPTVDSLVFMIGIIVANVPEALLSTVTVALRLAAERLSGKGILVKHAAVIETLGSTTVICTDKTGTLTQNRMTVAKIWIDGSSFDCDLLGGYEGDTFDKESSSFRAFFRAAALCNRATFANDEQTYPILGRPTIGNASEIALLHFCEKHTHVAQHRNLNPKVAEIVFDSTQKWQLSIHRLEQRSTGPSLFILLLKGAPERVLERCSHILLHGKEVPLTTEWLSKCINQAVEYAKNGKRVLALAHLYLPVSDFREDYAFDVSAINFPCDKLTFIGLFALLDPPRPEVAGAVEQCRKAGIKVIMITGDHPATAKAIARATGIFQPGHETIDEIVERERCNAIDVDRSKVHAIVVEGSHIDQLTADDWEYVLSRSNIVFARISPLQKLKIVEENQRRRDIVAVTGDGVNDVAALKRADFGIAMGMMGSDLARDVADIVLLNDNFASIIEGVEEGRLIFDNLKKSLAYVLSSNIPQMLPFLIFITADIPLPLSTILILVIDCGTDLWPAISVAYEPPEADLMSRPPRQSEALVTSRLICFAYFQIGVMQCLAGFFVYLVVMGDYGFSPSMLPGNGYVWANDGVMIAARSSFYRLQVQAHAQTAYFVAIIITQWADLIISKTRNQSIFTHGMRNQWLNVGLIVETVIGILIIYVPWLNPLFGTGFLLFVHLIPSIPFALLIFAYDEARRYIIRKYPDSWFSQMTRW